MILLLSKEILFHGSRTVRHPCYQKMTHKVSVPGGNTAWSQIGRMADLDSLNTNMPSIRCWLLWHGYHSS